MTTTAKKNTVYTFSPSVNIIRDTDVNLHYIPTPNATQIFNRLVNDFRSGIRSFSIVGAYGTGKSSFLWALERNLNRKQEYFGPLGNNFKELRSFDFISFVGEYRSVTEVFSARLGLSEDFSTADTLRALDKYYKALHKAGKGLVILMDEFGKFLEYAAKNNPENELYFIQQLAEYANDSRHNIFFITTLHQDFNGYSRNLTKSQQNEWDKVKGRLKEITFNEPVEQLLFLASERVNELKLGRKDKNFTKLFKVIEEAKAFPLKDFFNESFAEKVLPFDILSASVLTLALQRYGQNERSLFSFIEANDPWGIRDFETFNVPYYNLACVYDYLMHNYHGFLSTKYNPHYQQWATMRTSIEMVEGSDLSQGKTDDALKLLKTIGMLGVFAPASIHMNFDFLSQYGKYSLGIEQPENILKALEGRRIIRYVNHSHRYVLPQGTDLDIELAIDEAGHLVERVTHVVNHLNKYFDFPYIPAKAISYEGGTPRFFAFHLSESSAHLEAEGDIDGYINLVFSENAKDKETLIEASRNCDQAILYGWYSNTGEIKKQLYEIEKIKKVKESNQEDKIALRELDAILQHHVRLLNHYVLGDIYSENSVVQWYFQGKNERVNGRKPFNRLLSKICEEVYPGTPVYRNEMVNKAKLSGAIIGAKKNFVKALVENWSESDLGFESTKFPPEKTVYLSLLRETGIHTSNDGGGYTLGEPADPTFMPIWAACVDFLHDAKQGKRNLQELVDILAARPFKLKQGFIDFWLPTFLFIKRDDFALFDEDAYIPFLSEDTLDLIGRKPRDFDIKAFDLEGVKLDIFNRYRLLLNQSQKDNPVGPNFIETIRPFLTFIKQLPPYAKNTKRLSKKALAFREAIMYSRSPEETFFEKLPQALGYTVNRLQNNQEELETYVIELQDSIREVRTCYGELVNRLENVLLQDIIGQETQFLDYKAILQNRFRKLKKHLLLPYQKVFYQRVMSELDDRNAWLASLTQACVGKSLDTITDEEETVLYERLKELVHELDNLCELSKGDIDNEKELVFKLEVTSFVEGLKKNLVRLPKSKSKELAILQGNIKAQLTTDRQLNIATLTKMLEDLLKNEK